MSTSDWCPPDVEERPDVRLDAQSELNYSDQSMRHGGKFRKSDRPS